MSKKSEEKSFKRKNRIIDRHIRILKLRINFIKKFQNSRRFRIPISAYRFYDKQSSTSTSGTLYNIVYFNETNNVYNKRTANNNNNNI